jgi:putative effector of murein hydrolase LrgA (UPF0299 family)
MTMPNAFLTLLACQLIGEGARSAFNLPVPGPVIGMFLLAAALSGGRGPVPPALDQTAEALIKHMGLLFVPAGVGLVAQVSVLRQEWLPILAALAGSTLLSTAVTGFVMNRILRPVEPRHEPSTIASSPRGVS